MSERDLIERLRARRNCQRCSCLSCGREGMGELHDHVCTDGPDCIETREKLRAKNRNLRLLCGDAADALRDREATIARLSEALAEKEKKGAEIEDAIRAERHRIFRLLWDHSEHVNAYSLGLLIQDDASVTKALPPRDLSQGGQHG